MRSSPNRGGGNRYIKATTLSEPWASPQHAIDLALLQSAYRREDAVIKRHFARGGGKSCIQDQVQYRRIMALHLKVLANHPFRTLSANMRSWIERLLGPDECERIRSLNLKDSTPWMLCPGNLPKKPPKPANRE